MTRTPRHQKAPQVKSLQANILPEPLPQTNQTADPGVYQEEAPQNKEYTPSGLLSNMALRNMASMVTGDDACVPSSLTLMGCTALKILRRNSYVPDGRSTP
eukprot:IDg10007t1